MIVPLKIILKFVIGCFEETVLNTFTRKSCEMDFPTAGLCQEVCLTSNYSLFGLQVMFSAIISGRSCQLYMLTNFCTMIQTVRWLIKNVDWLHRYLICLQFNKCVCLEQIPRQGSRGSNDCPSSCSGNYTTETNITFKHDCGGQKTFSLFKSGTTILIIYCRI